MIIQILYMKNNKSNIAYIYILLITLFFTNRKKTIQNLIIKRKNTVFI